MQRTVPILILAFVALARAVAAPAGAGSGVQQADVRPNPVVSYNAAGISGNPGIGAETRKPLAVVVIGGLVSATHAEVPNQS